MNLLACSFCICQSSFGRGVLFSTFCTFGNSMMLTTLPRLDKIEFYSPYKWFFFDRMLEISAYFAFFFSLLTRYDLLPITLNFGEKNCWYLTFSQYCSPFCHMYWSQEWYEVFSTKNCQIKSYFCLFGEFFEIWRLPIGWLSSQSETSQHSKKFAAKTAKIYDLMRFFLKIPHI